jgi:hypothetical protein
VAGNAPTRRVRRPGPFAALALAVATVWVGAVVVLQVEEARHELNAVQREPPRSVLAPTARMGAVHGPEFHVDEPREVFELAPPGAYSVVDPALPAPASHSSQGITDLISLA